ncbi:arylsulfatase [Bacteroides helcogenes]|uniref:Sulfatase n=1 Tax=Bacteroides helcogenes (strain ATCC 35417 / DSM 20613 / JCM 6297 / CCUG 15421 / P 36-108) TaxID=693979 RepID=E6SR73_BACT6|nr:arylsulfatase [Bacteroides helcogenes]ADV42077.1 sulfatase [Bacteroides helcogenes P 36-108]MDY5240024.1 arylsulfatase [Bacteroides helcogenes]
MKLDKLFLGCSLFSSVALSAQEEVTRPNIIYILMDDLGYGDLQCYGQQKIETPNIDRLRESGMKFTQHYSGSPVSAPSRCVLMTGLHSGHAQIRGNDELAIRGAVQNHDSMFVHKELEGQYPLKAGTMTIGRMLQEAGYITGCFGKWGLGYPTSDGVPDKQGFDSFYGYNCQRQAHTYYPPFLYANDERVYLENKVLTPHAVLDKDADPYKEASYAKYTQKQYANDLIFDRLLSFVDEHKGIPFFAMWTTPLPHVSLQAPERWVRHYVEKFGDEKPYTGTAGYLPCRYPHATYAAMISYFDEQVGKLVERLKENGVYENTVIIYTSDNGPTFNGGTDSPWFNSGGLFKSEYGWGKCFLHEGGIRVPAIFAWPGKIEAGSESDLISGFQDVMPTLAEIAGIESPATDGISFLPALTGKKQKIRHEYLYWEFPELDGERAVRMGKWKALWGDIKHGNNHIQLFNLDNDVREEHDVAAQHPDIIKQIRDIMKKEHVEAENPKFRM